MSIGNGRIIKISGPFARDEWSNIKSFQPKMLQSLREIANLYETVDEITHNARL